MTEGSNRFTGGSIRGSSLTLFLFCELSEGVVSAGLSSISRTGSPVDVNIFGGAMLIGGSELLGSVLAGFGLGEFGNRRLVFPVGAPRVNSLFGFESTLEVAVVGGANCRSFGRVGVAAIDGFVDGFGFATPEPMIGFGVEFGGVAGGCFVLAKRMEPTTAWAVFGSFGIRVSSRVFPA